MFPPIPQDAIGENFKWRDWFRKIGALNGTDIPLPFGSFSSTATQSVTSINTPTKVTLSNTDEASEIALSNNQIKVTTPGLYNVQFSIQVTNSNSQAKDMDIWFRKGNSTASNAAVDIANTASVSSVHGTHGGQPGYLIVAANFFIRMVANDYIEAWWAADDTGVQLNYLPAITTPFASPGAPSAIITLTYISK